MKKTVLPLLLIFTSMICLAQQPAPNPPKPRVIIQTPFGPKEVDADAVAPGTPVTPVAPATQIPQPQAPPPPSVPAAPAPASALNPPAQESGGSPILLNFDNATDIYPVIKIICDALKLNCIVDPAVKGTININTAGNLRRSDLLPILETILKINNATMIKTGNFYEIVPAANALRQPLQVQERVVSAPPDDQMVLQIVRMNFVAATEMSRVLTPYLGEGASVVVHDSGNILLISERRSNLRKLLEIVDVFDSSVFAGGRVRMYVVKNSLATDLANDLKLVFSGYSMSDATSAVRFVPLARLNSILVVASNESVFPEIDRLIERLDQTSATSGLRPYVYKVKNSKASDLKAILGELYGSRVQLSGNYQAPGAAAPAPAAPGGAAPAGAPAAPSGTGLFATPGQPASAAGNTATGFAMNGQVRVISDEVNNALIIQTTPPMYAEIERMLLEIDILRKQVLIDAQIYEVTLDDSMSLGLSALLQNRGTLAPSTTGQFAAPAGGVPSLSGQTFALVGRSRELLMFLNASENRSRVRTLSAPSVMVSDNASADFQVGAEVPVPTSTSVTPVQSGGTNLFAQTISFRPTGVIMRVKPLINEGGNVTLDVSQEVSQASAGGAAGGGVSAPTIGKALVNSTIVVQDGQTIAISGFIRENNDLTRRRIPLIGRVPGIGVLFGNTSRSTTRSELIVLITPHVLKTHADADVATEELKEKLRELKKIVK